MLFRSSRFQRRSRRTCPGLLAVEAGAVAVAVVAVAEHAVVAVVGVLVVVAAVAVGVVRRGNNQLDLQRDW